LIGLLAGLALVRVFCPCFLGRASGLSLGSGLIPLGLHRAISFLAGERLVSTSATAAGGALQGQGRGMKQAAAGHLADRFG
jgi:hypothetical protein